MWSSTIPKRNHLRYHTDKEWAKQQGHDVIDCYQIKAKDCSLENHSKNLSPNKVERKAGIISN